MSVNNREAWSSLPLTPFHYPLAYVIYRLDRRLSLPGLIVGSLLPDLEVPVIILLFGTQIPDRLVLHSLLGAATVGTLLSLIFTVLFYPLLISAIFPVDKLMVKERCRLSFGLVLSCLLGNLSHVLLDITNHPFNPIFWPFLMPGETPSPIYLALGGMVSASLIIHALLIILFVALFINKREKFWEQLLVK